MATTAAASCCVPRRRQAWPVASDPEWQIPATDSSPMPQGQMQQASSMPPAILRAIESRMEGAALDAEAEQSAQLRGRLEALRRKAMAANRSSGSMSSDQRRSRGVLICLHARQPRAQQAMQRRPFGCFEQQLRVVTRGAPGHGRGRRPQQLEITHASGELPRRRAETPRREPVPSPRRAAPPRARTAASAPPRVRRGRRARIRRSLP